MAVPRFLLLSMSLALPLTVVGGLNLMTLRQSQDAMLMADARLRLRSVVSDLREGVNHASAEMSFVADTANLRGQESLLCRTSLGSRAGSNLLNLRLTDSRGVVRCTTAEDVEAQGMNELQMPEVSRAMNTWGFMMSAPGVGPFEKQATLPMAVRWGSPLGPRGVVMASLDIGGVIGRSCEEVGACEGESILVSTMEGTVLASFPSAIGGRITPAMMALLNGGQIGVARSPWPDGRVLAIAIARSEEGGNLAIAVGIDPATYDVTFWSAVRLTVLSIASASLIGYLLIALAGEAVYGRPVRILTKAVREWKDGNVDARARLGNSGVVSELGRLFDAMADGADADRRRAINSIRTVDALLQSMSDVVAVTHLDGRPQLVNEAFCKMAGMPLQQILGLSDLFAMDPSDERELAHETVKKVIANGLTTTIDHMRYNVSLRQRRFYETVYSPLINADGEVWGIATIARDATDYIRTREELTEAKDSAEKAVRQKTTFIASAAHDLRQPLQGAMLYADVASAAQADPEMQGNAIARLRGALSDMKILLDSLLDLSKLDAGVQPTISTFHIAPVLQDVVAGFEGLAHDKGILLTIDNPDSLTIVESDPTMVARMLRNLVENAVRYTEKGSVTVKCVSDGEKSLWIDVCDTGTGIAPEDIDRIWGEFQQVGNEGRNRRLGLGLGLSIVSSLVRALGHSLRVNSTLGQGSCFGISIPLAPRDTVDEPAPPERQSDPGPANGKILVIDDDETITAGMCLMLERVGYLTRKAATISEALEAVHGFEPDLILVDYRLGFGVVGTDVLSAIRERLGREVPAILVTGELGDQPAIDAAMLGIGVLHKPAEPARVLVRVAETLAAVQVANTVL